MEEGCPSSESGAEDVLGEEEEEAPNAEDKGGRLGNMGYGQRKARGG